ncbi:MAG: 50S ribosomal protein L22 [Mycoplasmataceae bacterium]|jgi:ribosomal protein L22|nr:50S ribosomal protein L22 [Mycoplasmataceae bacterium]
MAKTVAQQFGIHLSSRKAGLICDLIRSKTVDQALTILTTLDKKGAAILLKLLKSAIANATHNQALDVGKLYVLNALANQGKTIKRTLPRAKGSANLLRKRHCHLIITLSDDINDKPKKLNKHTIIKKNDNMEGVKK